MKYKNKKGRHYNNLVLSNEKSYKDSERIVFRRKV